jgi:hypothetical protein
MRLRHHGPLVAPLCAGVTLIVLVTGVVIAAPGQVNSSRAFGPGHCGPADPTYVRVANATGGQVMPLGPDEIVAAAPLMMASSGTETVLWLTSSLAPNGRVIKVPVDGVTSRVSFIASTVNSLADLVVVDPRGTPVGAGMPGVDASAFACVRAVTIDRPAAGEWSVRVSGTGTFWLTVHATSELALEDAEFVHLAGRPGHEGLFKIQGQPLAGRPATLRARVPREEVGDAKFDLVSMSGATLQATSLAPVAPASIEAVFVGDIAQLPTVPFRVRVSGRDRTGAAYQRVSSVAFQAATVEVAGPPTIAVERARQTPVKVRISNLGSPVQLQVVAVFGARTMRVEPATVRLNTNESREVTVVVDVPAGPATSSEDLIVSAGQAGGGGASNSAIIRAAD